MRLNSLALTDVEVALLARVRTDGGFSQQSDEPYRTDATAWAIITLSSIDADKACIQPAMTRLMADQHEDGSISIAPDHPAAFWPTPLAILGLLCHEGFSLSYYPLIAAILWDLCRHRRLRWSVALLQVLLVLAAFLAIVHFGTLKISPDLLLNEATHRTSVPVQRQLFDVMASNYGRQRALVSHFYRYRGMEILYALTALLSVPYFALLVTLLRRSARAREDSRFDMALRLILFALPLTLCCLGHDVARWIAACAVDATLFLCYLALSDPRVRDVLRAWATGPRPFLWLAWFLITGPYGATGIRVAERLSVLWTGP